MNLTTMLYIYYCIRYSYEKVYVEKQKVFKTKFYLERISIQLCK